VGFNFSSHHAFLNSFVLTLIQLQRDLTAKIMRLERENQLYKERYGELEMLKDLLPELKEVALRHKTEKAMAQIEEEARQQGLIGEAYRKYEKKRLEELLK
jgi:hypothetical protein